MIFQTETQLYRCLLNTFFLSRTSIPHSAVIDYALYRDKGVAKLRDNKTKNENA